MANDVTFKHEDYLAHVENWTLVDDVCAGEKQVKSKGELYLPKPNPKDKSPENQARYAQYKLRAVFYAATARTLHGLVGAAFRKAPEFVRPTGLDYLLKNADGKGVSLAQQARKAVSKTKRRGRHALYVDYPKAEPGRSKLDDNLNALSARIISIDAKNVTNWKTETVGNETRLSLVVISESVSVDTEDGFGSESANQYRVLRLVDSVYQVEVWKEATGKGQRAQWQLAELVIPTDSAGNTWREIPFIFIGAENNDADVDESPLLDMATLNLAHYRNSADYEDSVFVIGQPQGYISGLDQEWADRLEKKGLAIGSRSFIPLPAGGQIGFAQPEANSLVKEAMDAKEKQLVALGARLVERGQAVKTATEVQGESEVQHSVLSLIVSNVSDAYTKALNWCARYMGSPENVEFKINDEFIRLRLDPGMITALVQAWQQQALPREDMFNELKRGGFVRDDLTFEDYLEQIETDSGGIDLDD